MASMSEGPANPRPRWFQFTIRRIMAATFWLAVCFGAANIDATGHSDSTMIAVIVVMYWSAFVAVGTLLGRPLISAIVGIGVIGGYVILLDISIRNHWTSFP